MFPRSSIGKGRGVVPGGRGVGDVFKSVVVARAWGVPGNWGNEEWPMLYFQR